MSIVVLALGTVFSLIFLILLFMGGKYDYMIEPLDSDIYPLKFFYSAGYRSAIPTFTSGIAFSWITE